MSRAMESAQPTPVDFPEEADPDLDGESRAILAPLGTFRRDGLPRRQPPPQPGDALGQEDRLYVRHAEGEQLFPRITQGLTRPPVDVDDAAPAS